MKPWITLFAILTFATTTLLATTHPVVGPKQSVSDKKEKKKKKEKGEPAEKAATDETVEPSQKEKKKKKGEIKPYEEVITEEAQSDEGIFKIHRIDQTLYFEIPPAELGTEFVLVNRIARTTNGVGYGGQKSGTRVVKWVRHQKKILLKAVDYSVVSDPTRPISKAVEAARNETIIMSFEIKALGPEEAPVIDVTQLYTSDVYEMSVKSRLQAQALDKKRSFVEEALSFPNNIEVRATHTYTRAPKPRGPRTPRPAARFSPGMNPGTATLLMHFSMVKLPDDPMMPRLLDERVGYFWTSQVDFGRDEHSIKQRHFITRWRLEKKDPAAELSEPIKPIVYYLDSATPKKWIPYLKKGVEKWQAAFEAAGFKNAIIAKEAPTPEEDPEWHPEDARYSVIRWLPSTIENAYGPHVADPRTGEILESDIMFYHNVQNLLRSWYFLQVGPLDPRARTLPFPDELMGELIEYVAAHEVGHTLGFRHNMKSSSTYPFEKIRDPEWLAVNSHTPSMMDYSRFNYVAQPEDGIPVKDLIPKVGPYDKWATMWGYKPIPGAKTPDEEKATLDSWARQQDDIPWLRFSTKGPRGVDPGDQSEAVGDSDAVKATSLGLKNLGRVTDMLLEATTHEGEPWDDLEELYGRMISQWTREMAHVIPLIGGFDSLQRHGGQEGPRFQAVPRDRQEEAVAFLNKNAMQTPVFMIRPEILRLIESSGAIARITSAQGRILGGMISLNRIGRLIEQEALDGESAYQATSLLSSVRQAVWSELDAGSVKVDPYRRNLQRAYLANMDRNINRAAANQGDARAMIRGELRRLYKQITTALSKTGDTVTRYHLEDARDRLDATIHPEKKGLATRAKSFADPAFVEDYPHSCWDDRVIIPD